MSVLNSLVIAKLKNTMIDITELCIASKVSPVSPGIDLCTLEELSDGHRQDFLCCFGRVYP